MQREFGACVLQFRGRDEAARCNAHGMQPAFEIVAPEAEKAVEDGKSRRDIQLLPDVALEHRRMVRHVIKNFGGRQPIALQRQLELVHLYIAFASSVSWGLPPCQ